MMPPACKRGSQDQAARWLPSLDSVQPLARGEAETRARLSSQGADVAIPQNMHFAGQISEI